MKYFQLQKLVRELGPRLEGGRVQKIYQPDEQTLQLALYTGGEKEFLTLRIAPRLVSIYTNPGRTGPRGEDPPGFCRQLRSRIMGAVLTSLEKAPGDRIIRFTFSGGDEGTHTLVAELFSIAANCFLLESDGRIFATMNPAAARSRGNLPGQPYTPPEPPNNPPDDGEQDDRLERLKAEKGLPDYNSAVRDHYEALAGKGSVEEAKVRLRRELKSEQKRLKRLRSQHERTLREAEDADWYRESGDILSANFRSIRRGMDRIHLPDLYSGDRMRNREIELDPKLTPQENIERYFKRHRKLTKAQKFARSHLPEVRRQLAETEELLGRMEEAGSLDEVSAVAGDAGIDVAGEPSQRQGEKRGGEGREPYRKFEAADGSLVMVGRGSRRNDELTFRVANGNDLWLHVSQATGAHVVLRCAAEGMFTDEALLDAAHLAAFYSSLRDQPLVDVDYAHRKYIGRAPGGEPGRVVMSSRKTIRLRVDSSRLDRLLGRKH